MSITNDDDKPVLLTVAIDSAMELHPKVNREMLYSLWMKYNKENFEEMDMTFDSFWNNQVCRTAAFMSIITPLLFILVKKQDLCASGVIESIISLFDRLGTAIVPISNATKTGEHVDNVRPVMALLDSDANPGTFVSIRQMHTMVQKLTPECPSFEQCLEDGDSKNNLFRISFLILARQFIKSGHMTADDAAKMFLELALELKPDGDDKDAHDGFDGEC